MLANIKSFYNNVLAVEDNIFEACSASWVPFKRVLLEELYDTASKLEGHTALHILPEVISYVNDMVEAAGNVGLKVDWKDRIIGKISKARDQYD